MEEENKSLDVEQSTLPDNKESNKKNISLLFIIVLVIVIIGITCSITYVVKTELNKKDSNNNKETTKTSVEKTKVNSEYRINSNGLEKFDLAFLKLENNEKNMVYSPLSIKYALQMLGEGANNNTKSQIDAVIGDYKYKKYDNNDNMSFANAMFIKDTYENKINEDYINNLKNRYNAEVITDSFKSAKSINKWVSDKTFNLIDKIEDDDSIKGLNFALINALAINMDWTNAIQCALGSKVECKPVQEDNNSYHYSVNYKHENYLEFISRIEDEYYSDVKFASGIYAKSVEIGASINKYDIVNTLGRENIRKEIEKEYIEWLNDGEINPCSGKQETKEDISKFVDQFIDELDENYKQLKDSTDFYFEDNDEIKVFAKDLKEYNETQLQYVGIMPKNEKLKAYVDNINEENLREIINSLKPIELSSFEDGVITRIKGKIPLFSFDYELGLENDLRKLGITDIFDNSADLSNMIKSNDNEIKVSHKANIEFSNEGIKASAVTSEGGLGDASCKFEHLYEVPVKEIDLTFDHPYLFLIRDKKSGEIWFIGTVYEPTENVKK